MQTRFLLLVGAAAIGLGAGSASADTPSNEELFQMLKQQQRTIEALRKELKQTRDELNATRKGLRREVSATKKELDVTRKEVRETKRVVATKTDLERTKAELGTQPSQSVFRLDQGALGMGFSVFGEFVYLRPSAETQFAGFASAVLPTVAIDTATTRQGYEPGFRVGAGYNFGSGWDVSAAYRYLSADSSRTAVAGPNQIVFSALNPLTVIASPDTAVGRYEATVHAFDADVGLRFRVGEAVRMRAFAGLRYVNIDQKMAVDTFTGGAIAFQDRAEAEFWGVGPRMGLKGWADIGWGFGVFGHFAGGFAVGSVDSRFTTTVPPLGNANITEGMANGVQMVPFFDAAIGLGYNWRFSETMELTLKAGYQFESYLGVPNGRPDIISLGDRKPNFNLDGFFFRGSLKF